MKKTKKEQINWLVEWCRLEIEKKGVVHLTATNFDLHGEFEEFAQTPVWYTLWRSRIREVASILELTGKRVYIADATPAAGIPRYSYVYSNTSGGKVTTPKKDDSAWCSLSAKYERLFGSN